MKLSEFSVQRKIATTAIAALLILMGLLGLSKLPIDFLPGVTYPLIKVNIWYKGAPPEEIERDIAEPLERQLATVEGLDYLESSSIEGMYALSVNFRYDVDVDVAYQDVLAAMTRAARNLPKDIDPPVVIKADPSQLPVLQLVLNRDDGDLLRLREWAENDLQLELLTIPGVAGAEITGGLEREIQLELDPRAMEKFQISIPEIENVLRTNNLQQFAGRVTQGKREIIARTMGELQTIPALRRLIVRRTDNGVVRLEDLAKIKDGHKEVRVLTRLDGNPSVKLSILKQPDANTVEVAKAVAKKIAQIQERSGDGIQFAVLENQATYVEGALHGVTNTAWLAALLVVSIVWLFLGAWRLVLVVALALPVTLILNFGLMHLGGFSLNIFSLSGIVVAIGVLVDNTILVVEAFERHQHHDKQERSIALIVLDSVTEIFAAMLAGTFSFLVLFMPFLLVPGLMSLLFQEMILVIAGIVLVSLLVALTLTPHLISVLGHKPRKQANPRRFEAWFDRVSERYQRGLDRMMRHGNWVIAAFLLLLATAAFLYPRLGSEFLPKMDDGRILVKVKMPTGSSVAATDSILTLVEEKLQGDSVLIESILALAGGRVVGSYTYEVASEGELDVQLIPREERSLSTVQAIRRIQDRLADVEFPGGKVMVSQMKTKGIRSTGNADMEMKIYGNDLDTLADLGKQIVAKLGDLKALKNVMMMSDMNKPEFQVRLDQEKMNSMGVSAVDVSRTLKTGIDGVVPSVFRQGNDDYDIRLLFPGNRMKGLEDLQQVPIQIGNAGYVPLGELAQVKPEKGPLEIIRQDQIKRVIVQADVNEGTIGDGVDLIHQTLAGFDLPDGYRIEMGGQAEAMADMKSAMVGILLLAFFFAFVILAVQFDSWSLPLLVMAGIPFSLVGSVLALFVMGIPFGSTVVVGILLVVAAAVNESVLLLSYADQLRQQRHLDAKVAVITAGRIRLRPRIMTATAMMIGLVPLATGWESGSDMLQPMAVAAIGGILTALFTTLLLTPVLYARFSRRAPRAS